MDHIRISTHPFWRQRFKRRVEEKDVLTHPLESPISNRVAANLAKEMIERAVREIFSETVQLVRIRYDELDRQSAHGLRPVEKDYWETVIPED